MTENQREHALNRGQVALNDHESIIRFSPESRYCIECPSYLPKKKIATCTKINVVNELIWEHFHLSHSVHQYNLM